MLETMRIEEKVGRNWEFVRAVNSEMDGGREEIYHSLMHDMIAKKLHQCTYIKSIKDRSNYDGTRTITVTYDNSVRRVYVIKF